MLAEHVNFLLAGVDGSYPVEDVSHRSRGGHDNGKRGRTRSELRSAVTATLQALGIVRGRADGGHSGGDLSGLPAGLPVAT